MKQIIIFLTFLWPLSLFGQLTETFNGPELNSLHPWQGDLYEFFINSYGEAEFISIPGEAGEASIWLPVGYSTDMTWEMEVMLDFRPTNSNNVRIFIYQPSLHATAESWYIQSGNNSRQISLYRQSSGTPTLCISGRTSLLEEPYTRVFIKVTLEENKKWTLYTRTEQETAYTKEGECIREVEQPSEKGYFTILCRYIKSRISSFCFDNIRITHDVSGPPLPPKPDPEPEPNPGPSGEVPELTDLTLVSGSTLSLTYSEEVEIPRATAEISGYGYAEEIVYGATWNMVLLHFPFELVPGKQYELRISGLSSFTGIAIPEEIWAFEIEEDKKPPETPGPEPPAPPTSFPAGCILINEVMANPKGLTELPETEYIELYNTTDEEIHLYEWELWYGTQHVILPDKILPAADYALLYRSGRIAYVDEGGLDLPLSNFPAALANTGKELRLKDPAGNLIDEVIYPKATPARSWERFEDSWHLAVDPRGGTPGSRNHIPDDPVIPLPPAGGTIEPGDILFNELLPNPYPDGSEFIELYNRSGKTLSLESLSIAVRKPDGTLSTRYPLAGTGTAIDHDSYIVLTKDKPGVTAFYDIPEEDRIREVNMPILSNVSATLVLFRTSDEVVIDEVSYSSKWHSSSLISEKGVSLERVDPERDTQDASNWSSASALSGYATPGYKNSQYLSAEEEHQPAIGKPVYHADGTYSIPYQLDKAGYLCRAWLYSLAGIRQTEIANHTLTGSSGSLHWDGRDSTGKPVLTGLYLLYIEFYHPEGGDKRFKLPFPVR
ncbi:MAG: lamin tail domain-containing protein [Tannerellaceae bacterium]|nr:lamin tail domain-containing protein [Tannerellaceae bacterium]